MQSLINEYKLKQENFAREKEKEWLGYLQKKETFSEPLSPSLFFGGVKN